MRLLILFLTLIILSVPAASAANKPDMNGFKNIPIAHDGRIKPLDSFAKATLKEISGKDEIENMDAIDWLALTIFDPQAAAQIPLIEVNNKTLTAKLELLADKKRHSYEELQAGLQNTAEELAAALAKPEDQRTNNETALLHVHERAQLLANVMRSFSAFLPLDITLPENYVEQIEGDINYIQLTKIEPELDAALKKIMAKKGQDPSRYTPQELATAKAVFYIQTVRAGGQGSEILRVIPSQWQSDKQNWLSPWSTVMSGEGSPASAFLLSQWTETAKAYRNGNTDLWEATTADLLSETALQSAGQVSAMRFAAERFYMGANLYVFVLLLYALGIAATFSKNIKPHIKPKLPAILAAFGIGTHITALALRIYILERPPVGTLYESILFVSLICAGFGLRVALARKSPLTLVAGLASAIALLLCAPVFQPASGNLEVLVAALNTNFWLTTHVLIITAGYGICILTACLAHTTLYLKAKNADMASTLKLQQNTYHLSLAALLFMAVGTILGGIWADQSWGRFWGWDPKENGALLIVLWLIWAQHGRHAQKLLPNQFLAVIAALNIIVALSWFGVNLLNVGLHSYGFTQGLAGGLFAFCTLQIAIIVWLYIAAKRKNAHA